jgi:serine/threonine-protein kinase RsbW
VTQKRTLRFTVPARLDQLARVAQTLQQFMAGDPWLAEDRAAQYEVELAVNEIVVNIIMHSYAESGEGAIGLRVVSGSDGLLVETVDSGRSFDPTAVVSPDLETVQEHGYGLFLVEQLMDTVQYRSARGRNHWHLFRQTKRADRDSADPA